MNDDMLRFRNYIWLLLLMTVGLIACQSDVYSTQTESKSGFYISLCDDVSVDSRATPSELGAPVASNFDLKITNKETGNLLYDGKFTDGLIPAAQGEYKIVASYGSNLELGLDTPYYEGTADGVVETDKATTVSVQCRVANALASAVFSNSEVFEKEFSSYALKVSVGSQYVTLKPTDNKSAYYRAGAHPSFAFVGVMTDGTRVEIPIENEKLQDEATFAAAAHCKITLTMEATSGLKLKIEKIEVEKVTVSETIPVEWLPKPKVSGFEDITYVETDDAPQNAVIDYTASLPIQDMELTLNMQDEQYSIYNKTYTLSTLTSEDRANLGKLGIELPEVGVAKTGTINLQNLIGTMQTNAGATVDNTFSLRVKANNRWSDETAAAKTYKVEVVKPEFSVKVDERNCWSREFTVDEVSITSGNAERLKENLVYQYYNGSEWVDCADRNNTKGRLQQFASRAEDISTKQYKVRALYRGAISSNEVTATLETPVQLPNSDMDEWTDEKYKGSYYRFYPWTDKGDCHWDTNNLWTTRHEWNGASTYHYNGFHAVSYVPGRSGLAAELRNTGNGRGNTKFTSINVKTLNKVPGMLFTGTFVAEKKGNDISGSDSWHIDKNASFASRPTGIKFWYKYKPESSDSWTAHLELLDADNQTICQQDVTSSEVVNDWKEEAIALPYVNSNQYKKAAYIYLSFSSSDKSGDNMPYRKQTYKFYIDKGAKTVDFSDAIVGSILTIDDISLVYDK